MISVIIPVINEEKFIGRCIDSVKKQKTNFEIIIVDGGSLDRTLEITGNKVDRTITSNYKNLAYQLNLGARFSRGDILVFLHADSRLPDDAFKKIEACLKNNEMTSGGAFTMVLEGKRFFYKILSLGGNIYSKVTGTFFGDRAIFVRKNVFNKLSGFKQISSMADVDFSRRMKKTGITRMLDGPVSSSGRKFYREPFWYAIYIIFWSLSAFKHGIKPEIIDKKYYKSYGKI